MKVLALVVFCLSLTACTDSLAPSASGACYSCPPGIVYLPPYPDAIHPQWTPTCTAWKPEPANHCTGGSIVISCDFGVPTQRAICRRLQPPPPSR